MAHCRTMNFMPRFSRALLAALVLLSVSCAPAETFRVVTYNVENYLDRDTGSRKAKSAAAKAKVESVESVSRRWVSERGCPRSVV